MRIKIYKDVMTCLQKRLMEEYLKEGFIVKGSLKEYKKENNYDGDVIVYGSVNYVNLCRKRVYEIDQSKEYQACKKCEKYGGSTFSGSKGFYTSRCSKKCLLKK